MEYRDSDLIFRYCKGLCTEAEQKKVEALLNVSEEYRRLFRELRTALALGDDIREMETIDVQVAFRKTQNQIRRKRYEKWQHQLIRYAAFMALPLFFSSVLLAYLYFNESRDERAQYASITASAGSVVRYELPDNSVVWLNSGSTLRYPMVFNKKIREVDLQGEAFFEVQSGKEYPFYVNTPSGVRVFVTGTRFNVSSYENEGYVEAVLESGQVNVLMPGHEQTESLQPGEQIFYDKNTLRYAKSEVNVFEKTAWKDGKLVFRDTPLPDMLKRLSRHFNIEIQFNNISGKEYKYRATFRNETLYQILDYLGKSVAMRWKVEESVQQIDGTFTKEKVIVDLY